MSPQIVPATAALLERFYGATPKRTVRALAAVLCDEPLCIAGVYSDGDRLVGFADMRAEMRGPYRKTGMRMARRVMAEIMAGRRPVFTLADPDIEAAPRFLEHLGFQPIREGVYAWLA